MINATALPLYPRERAPVPIVEEAGWALEPVGTCLQETKSFAPSGIRTQNRRARSDLLRYAYSEGIPTLFERRII
jgi:hypothetical protein